MYKNRKWVIFSLALLSLIAFIICAIPNSKASENLAMVTMFEPDEAAMTWIPMRMVSPQPNLVHTIYRLVAYGFYHYGWAHFLPSALVYKILTWLGQGDNMPLVMLSYRQLITVLPMIASLLVLVYLQDQFKTWRSVALFIFLLSVPAVVQNGFWWHPDGLAMFFSNLVLYFLWKDNRQFGKHFYIAAAVCGVLTALKVIGLFFFLTIAMVLIWGLVEKRLTWKQFFAKAFTFILVMAAGILISSPYLLIPSHRELAIGNLMGEIFGTSDGYLVYYAKGLQAAWSTIRAYYGELIFLLAALAVSVWSLWDKETRYLRALILSWFIPLTVHLLLFSHFKPHYWLPVAIPMLSNLAFLPPANMKTWRNKDRTSLIKAALLLVVVAQFGVFLARDVELFRNRITRAENNQEINFYYRAADELAPVAQDLTVYYDYRLYLPETEGWFVDSTFDLLTYNYIQERDFDVLMLSHQRIRDYLQPSAVGIDADTFALSQAFYSDADNEQLEGYKLLFRDPAALLYIKEELCQTYYSQERCE